MGIKYYSSSLQKLITLVDDSNVSENALESIVVRVGDKFPFLELNSSEEQYLGGFVGELWNIFSTSLNLKNVTFDDSDRDDFDYEESFLDLRPYIQDYYSFMDSTLPIAEIWYGMFMRYPEGTTLQTSFWKVFSLSLWLTILLVFFAIAILFWGFCKLKHQFENDNVKDTSFGTCFFWATSGFFNQGIGVKFSFISASTCFLVSSMLGAIISYSLSAVLMSFLTINKIEAPIKSFEEAYETKTHVVCMRTNNFAYTYFTENASNYNLSNEISSKWKGIINTYQCPDINNLSNIKDVICKDNTVVFESGSIILKLQKQNQIPCSLIQSPAIFGNNKVILSMRLNFKYTNEINKILMKLMSSGILKHLQKKWLNPEKNISSPQTFIPINLTHVGVIFLILFIFTLAAVIILLLEILYFKLKLIKIKIGRKKAIKLKQFKYN